MDCLKATYGSDLLEGRLQTNAAIHQELAAAVLREVLQLPDQTPRRVSPWQVLDFSSIFSIDWCSGGERQGVFIKIPKLEISKRQVGLVTTMDRQFAAAGYDSLVRLSQAWKGADLGVSFIKPLAFLASYNAIVTQRAYGRDFFKPFRRQDLKRRFKGQAGTDQVQSGLNRLGQALSRYHQVFREAGLFEVEATGQKIRGYLARLRELRVDRRLLSRVGEAVDGLQGRKAPTYLADTIKGLDLRNILIDPQGRLFLLDPGKLKRDYQEADLARFLVTCRILYWGSPWFFLRLTPHRVYEQSFLHGYYGAAQPTWVLSLFIIKELLKHWLMAHGALGLQRWPQALKAMVKRTYIDSFYRQECRGELGKLAPGSGH
jgi:hypothetical protein